MLQKCGNRAHPFTGVWIMYIEMIWWVWKRACLIEFPCVAHYAISSLSLHGTPGSEPRANLRRANCLWGKWENYTFQQESAVVLQDPHTVLYTAGFMWQTPASFSMARVSVSETQCTTCPHLVHQVMLLLRKLLKFYVSPLKKVCWNFLIYTYISSTQCN